MSDLFGAQATKSTYNGGDIEVLEGLEAVRRRPGMYIGGTDDRALHHLATEILDNAMDEAVAGHASWIEFSLDREGVVTIRDNGRGIPIDEHPKFPGTSALEIVLTQLHSGGKFSGKAYNTSGGLHGVGLSVVNALSDMLTVEVARDRQLWVQRYARGKPFGPPAMVGPVQNRRGTTVAFHPDPEIFDPGTHFRAERLYRMARSKAYLFRGVEIRWRCDPELVAGDDKTPAEAVLHFPGGLADFLQATLDGRETVTPTPFTGSVAVGDGGARVEWAVAWPDDDEGFVSTYCNTIPTPQGGTHEQGLRSGLLRSLRDFSELTGNKRAAQVTAEDIAGGAAILLSIFIRDPQFQGQTKERLTSAEAARLVDTTIKDHFDHWLSAAPKESERLLDRLIEKAEERIRRRQKANDRKTPTSRIRLPGKLTDCSRSSPEGTEIFLVEGDSAGGSAKAARRRETQAILPLRGKILNVASASADKLEGNQEIRDLALALGCGTRGQYSSERLRYERVVIMTDADVDGAHIASLLMTFFYREMRGLIADGRLFLAQPPLYRVQCGTTTVYCRDDAHKNEVVRSFGTRKVEVSRFKGLGEMMPAQLRDTTMDPDKRTLLQVALAGDEDDPGGRETADLVERLMGRKPEMRLRFIQQNAANAVSLDI